jgi:hypothetical protein
MIRGIASLELAYDGACLDRVRCTAAVLSAKRRTIGDITSVNHRRYVDLRASTPEAGMHGAPWRPACCNMLPRRRWLPVTHPLDSLQ